MSLRHLSDNPIDQVLSTNPLGGIRESVRRRLLARYAPGRPITEARRSIESFGAKCTDEVSGPIVCRYSQFLLLGNRGVFGDEWREYQYFDFTVRLRPRRGALHDVSVCYTETREKERGLIFGKPDKPRESDFKTCP